MFQNVPCSWFYGRPSSSSNLEADPLLTYTTFRDFRQKTENDKTEDDFCFSFTCFSLGKKQKTIKRKSIFVFPLFVFSFGQKTKNRS